jgi:bifunctional non-homologous end joining protein LigD
LGESSGKHGKVRLLTRTGLDWTARFRPIATAPASLSVKTAYLDGEVAVLGPDGVTNFAALQDALSKGHSADLVYFHSTSFTSMGSTSRRCR